MFQHVEKDKILFDKKPRIDYLGIAEKEKWEHDALIESAKSENIDIVKSKEQDARKDGKKIVWYCCEYVRDILAGAINLRVRQDDFWGSFIPSFAGLENHTRAAELAGTTVHFNHQFSGYDCKGNFKMSFDADHISKVKAGISYHLERLENSRVLLYYIESLLGDIQNSKNLGSFAGMDKYSREIQPLAVWLEEERVKAETKAKVFLEHDTRPLFPFFQDGESLDLALRAAFETGLINQAGKWVHIGEKTKAISIFWRVAVETGLAKVSPVYKVISAIEIQFSYNFGKNAIDRKKPFAQFDNPKSEYPEKYKQLCKDLFAIMRPGKT